ncbi:sensor histidine kinase [Candidatus Nitrosopumilus sp. SW]|uniref:sensor histidine kinase n=1 Tax=Candidatus Nitrosopumilus sp. SW TaxID=2508726 RepID=UPI00114EA61B|nr:sensor histidine kinase [Candidatus Nitrosopumilus sp. SW]QDI89609.1 sensor histidine kinase [Candidatus Nitrosopumilus sp. SW]
MKIRTQLIFFFSIIIILSVGISSYFAISYTESSILDAEIAKMNTHNAEIMHEIETLHQRASEDLVFALKNPKFVEYFELPETKAGNVYDENGVLQFTEKQQEIKEELERWTYHFQNKFEVDETCLIDATGQEHARLVLSQIEINENLSPDEATAPFFESSFMKQKNEVHVQYPYVSPDTERWVFAYTSPVELGNGQKPAIYHFEMPMTVFEKLLDGRDGRMFVVDPNGYIIADTQDTVTETVSSFEPEKQFPSFQTAFGDDSLNILNEMKLNEIGSGSYFDGTETHYFVYERLSTFDWILIYEKPESLMLVGHTTLSDLLFTIGIIALSVTIIGIFSVIVISSRITRPITKLADEISKENPERLEELDVSDPDIGKISHSVNDLIQKMNSYQEEIHLQNQELLIQKQQLERMAKIGESASKLVHNLRTPLTVIKATVDLIYHSSKESLDDASIEKLDRIKSASENLETQIRSVLQYVREKPLDIQNVKLRDLINDTLNTIQIPSSVNVSVECSDDVIQCDPDKLQIVLMNIINNALEAVDKSGKITISSNKSNHDNQIQISDNGPGIPSENMAKIFDSLFTTKPSGTGLGLSFCKSVLEQHGGSITVSQNPTTFTISLPKKSLVKKSKE